MKRNKAKEKKRRNREFPFKKISRKEGQIKMGFLPPKREKIIPQVVRREVEREVEQEIEETDEETEVEEEKPVSEAKIEEKRRWVVVKELPTQVIREHIAEDGTILDLITIEEALSNFMNK